MLFQAASAMEKGRDVVGHRPLGRGPAATSRLPEDLQPFLLCWYLALSRYLYFLYLGGRGCEW